MRRVVVPPGTIDSSSVELGEDLRHYLVNVLRLRPGAPLLLVDGSGQAYRGHLHEVSRTTVRVRVEEVLPEASLPQAPRMTLIYGLSRPQRTELVMQKATELGADEIALAECLGSVVRGASRSRLDRWQQIVRQAARQCGRTRLPQVLAPQPLPAVLTSTQAELRLLAHPGAEPLSTLGAELAAPPSRLALAVGPEAGFAEEELALARSQGFRLVGLGPLRLRTETAALALLALTAFLSGRLECAPSGLASENG